MCEWGGFYPWMVIVVVVVGSFERQRSEFSAASYYLPGNLLIFSLLCFIVGVKRYILPGGGGQYYIKNGIFSNLIQANFIF